MGLPPPKTQRLVYDLQHLFFKTMTLEARIGPSERVFSGWTLGCNKNPYKPPTFNYRELSPSCSKLCSPLSQPSHTCLKDTSGSFHPVQGWSAPVVPNMRTPPANMPDTSVRTNTILSRFQRHSRLSRTRPGARQGPSAPGTPL